MSQQSAPAPAPAAALDPDYRKRKSTKKNPQPKMHVGAPGDELHDDPNAEASDAEMDDERARAACSTAGTRGYTPGSPPRTYTDGGGAVVDRLTMPQYKAAVGTIMRELFAEEDFDEARTALEELHAPFFGYEFVRRAVMASFERGDGERELVSRLLSLLYGVADLSMESIGKGFERLLETVDDLALDVPNARSMLAKFLARAVTDEILPPAFLTDPLVASLGGDVIDTAKALLSVPHSGERMEHVWHVTGVFTVPELKKAVALALQEYLLSNDAEEAARCIKELEAPHFHHEVVYRLCVLTLEKMPASPGGGSASTAAGASNGSGHTAAEAARAAAAENAAAAAEKAVSLLTHLRRKDVVSEGQVSQGFERVRGALPDLKLDVPHAEAAFAVLVAKASEAGVLPARFAAPAAAVAASGGAAAGGSGGGSSAAGGADGKGNA